LASDRSTEDKVDALLSRMTTAEKLQQVQLLSDGQITDADAKAGVGGVFSLVDAVKINHFQHVAVEQSRLHIPILFAYDTIHGYRTIFPVPLGAASSFDPAIARTDASIGARESATVGIKQVYSPMLDVSHEPRWGRIVEGNGEDPFLGSEMGVARVQGAQGDNYGASNKVVASPSTTSPTASPKAAGTTTPQTCPSSGCATSTSRRSMQLSTPVRAPSCAPSMPSTVCRAARTTTPRPTS
jgi:beta-glucosidase